MSINYEEVENNELLDNSILKFIPKKCECGSKIHFTENLRMAYCSNDTCMCKIENRVYRAAKILGMKSIGVQEAKALTREFEMISPFQLIMIDDEIDRTSIDNKINIKKDIMRIKCTSYKIYDIVRLIMIDDIEKVAYKIFAGYSSIADAYKDIDRYQVALVAERLCIKSDVSIPLAVNIYNKLQYYKDELMFSETKFNVKKEVGETYRIAIADRVNDYINNAEFIDYLRSVSTGKYNFILVPSVDNETDILIYDKDSLDSKWYNATKINDRYTANQIESGKIELSSVGKSDGLRKIGCKVNIIKSKELITEILK